MYWIILICFALMMAHELDAIDKTEWRIFPGTNLLPDRAGFQVFVLLHIPLIGVLVWAMFSAPPNIQFYARLGFAAFSIVHILLHHLYRHHPEYRFNSPLSKSLIWGTGVFGAIYLAGSLF